MGRGGTEQADAPGAIFSLCWWPAAGAAFRRERLPAETACDRGDCRISAADPDSFRPEMAGAHRVRHRRAAHRDGTGGWGRRRSARAAAPIRSHPARSPRRFGAVAAAGSGPIAGARSAIAGFEACAATPDCQEPHPAARAARGATIAVRRVRSDDLVRTGSGLITCDNRSSRQCGGPLCVNCPTFQCGGLTLSYGCRLMAAFPP